MPFDENLFTPAWNENAKKWAKLQLADLSQGTQGQIMAQLTAKLGQQSFTDGLNAAFSVDLPGPSVALKDVFSYSDRIRRCHWIILIRYSSNDPIAMHPRLASVQAAPGTDLQGTTLKDMLHLASTLQQNAIGGNLPQQIFGFVEQVMSVSRQELTPYKPSQHLKPQPQNLPSMRRLEYHQTGLQKADDPYLSTSCVLPCLNASDCHTVRDIRRNADFLGFYLVPGARIRLLWPPNIDYASQLFLTKYETAKPIHDPPTQGQIDNSWSKMVIEREIAYAYPPALDDWEICKINNPNK